MVITSTFVVWLNLGSHPGSATSVWSWESHSTPLFLSAFSYKMGVIMCLPQGSQIRYSMASTQILAYVYWTIWMISAQSVYRKVDEVRDSQCSWGDTLMKHNQSCWECKGSKRGVMRVQRREWSLLCGRHAGLMKLEETREWEMF